MLYVPGVKKPSALILDLDGTLLDSTADLAAGANAARRAFGLEPIPDAEVALHVGWGLAHLLRHAVPGADQRMETARAAFHEWYGAHLLDRSRPYEGADALLRAWSGRCALVTNKPDAYVERIVAELGWAARLAVVVGGDGPRKPSPEPVLRALAGLEVPAAAALFVGDSEVDQEAAGAAGVSFVAVPWGRVEAAPRLSLHELAGLR